MVVRRPAGAKGADNPVLDDRIRLLANLPGRYYLEKWRTDEHRAAFACRIQRISPISMFLAAPVTGEVGDWVTTHFDEFGVLRGKITRPLGFGFVMALKMSLPERERLAARVHWFEKHRNYEVSDQRRHKRIAPKSPQSTLILCDGTAIDCFVIDMSVSGAAVSADLPVEIGMPLALGTVVGRVIRILQAGFVIRFTELVDLEALEARLIRRRDQLCAG